MTFDQMIQTAAPPGASDIHLRAGHVPLVRIDGSLRTLDERRRHQRRRLEAIAARLLSPAHQAQLQTKLEVDVAWQAPGVGRIRASVFRQRGTIAVSMRLIPDQIPTLEELGLPPSVVELAQESRGLVLVTGATGSGKSTTLAALVDLINRTRALHVITIEDPIEFVHQATHGGRHAARSRVRHAGLRDRPAQRAAPGPGRDSHRRNARRGHDRNGARRPPKPATWCSRRCTRSTRPKPSTASSPCSRRTSRCRSGTSSPACSRPPCRSACSRARTAGAASWPPKC